MNTVLSMIILIRQNTFKQDNTYIIADYILKHNGIKVDVDSIFVIQVKRLHAYKRQLLNILHVIDLYFRM